MNKSIKEQKKEIITRDIERLKKQNRSLKKMAPYGITFFIIISFVLPFFPNKKGNITFENLGYIESSLINCVILFAFYIVFFLLTLLINYKKIDRLKKTVL